MRIFLVLLTLIFASNVWAANNFSTSFKKVAIRDWAVCYIDQLGLQCRQHNYSIQLPKNLNKPFDVGVARTNICVLDAGGIKCGAIGNGNFKNPPSDLVAPTSIVASDGGYCVLDSSRVICWGDGTVYDRISSYPIPKLTNPTNLFSGKDNYCAQSLEGFICWGEPYWGINEVPPEVTNPTRVAIESRYACAVQNAKVYCWGWAPPYWGEKKIDGAVTDVATGRDHACILDSKGINCKAKWSWFGVPNRNAQLLPLKDLKNPTRIFSDYIYTYVIDDQGLKCWGTWMTGTYSEPISCDSLN